MLQETINHQEPPSRWQDYVVAAMLGIVHGR